MGAYNSTEFVEKTGIDFQELGNTNMVILDKETNIINFLPTKKHGQNYNKIMSSFLKPALNFQQMQETIQTYTNHETGFCTTINLILAADGKKLIDHANYIQKLDISISYMSNLYPCKTKKTYRGMWLTEKEFNSYLEGEFQYIPSFLSTSRNPDKFYQNSKINCLMIFFIDCRPRRAFEVSAKFSKYQQEEEETLFSCYNKFKIRKKSKGLKFREKIFDFVIELEVTNEDYQMNTAKVLGILSCY